MNLVVALDTVRARDDWSAFDARVKREREACPRVTITEPQVRTAIPTPAPTPIPTPTPTPGQVDLLALYAQLRAAPSAAARRALLLARFELG